MAASPPILRGGFRPFFLAAALWGPVALTIFLLSLAGAIVPPSAMDPFSWHRHEMLFGFVAAAAAGYALTAIPNWTGRLPVAGAPLAALFGLWLLGRAALLWFESLGAIAAAVDIAFLVVLAAFAGREAAAAKGRNAALVVILLLLAAASALDHAEAAGAAVPFGLGARAGVALIVLMIGMIGGRIIPSFTRNWLVKQGRRQGLPGQPDRFDRIAMLALATALLCWTATPEAALSGAALALAAAAHAARLARWRGHRCWREPMVLILHVAYAWLPLGLALLALGDLGVPVPPTAGVHALTAGAMASMILAVMSRMTLSLTARQTRAGAGTTLVYLLVTLGAVLRVGAPLGVLDYTLAMRWAAILWAGGFLIFAGCYAAILLRDPGPGGSQ